MENQKNKKKIIQSIERMYNILNCFKRYDELGITEISNLVGLHKSTTNGIVSALRQIQFLEQNDETGKYKLGIELFRLSSYSYRTLKDIYEPYINYLSEKTNETIMLHTWNKNSSQCLTTTIVGMTESTHNIKYVSRIGNELPLHCTAVGKAILATLPENEMDSLLNLIEFIPVSNNTITSKETLIHQLDIIRSNGYAVNFQETEDGVVGVGVSIENKKGTPIIGLGIASPISRITEEKLKFFGELLIEIKNRINQELFP